METEEHNRQFNYEVVEMFKAELIQRTMTRASTIPLGLIVPSSGRLIAQLQIY